MWILEEERKGEGSEDVKSKREREWIQIGTGT